MSNTKYIFVTGGVVSGLGKGITAASLGRLMKNRGYKVTIQKIDPYINVDPGISSSLKVLISHSFLKTSLFELFISSIPVLVNVWIISLRLILSLKSVALDLTTCRPPSPKGRVKDAAASPTNPNLK